MLEHIMKEHDEYSVPGRRSEGVELPAHVRNDMTLTELEQSTSRIPKERWITPPSVLSGSDKENVPASSSRPPKRSLTASTGYKAAKRSRTFVFRCRVLASFPRNLLAINRCFRLVLVLCLDENDRAVTIFG